MDTLTPEERSAQMARVKCKDTKPEMTVRRMVHALGGRYRLHDASLPGKPDLVFKSQRKVIFVHGCFWHRHKGCPRTRLPKSRVAFWAAKLEENRKRDIRTKRMLTRLGWRYLIVWECETEHPDTLRERLIEFLRS